MQNKVTVTFRISETARMTEKALSTEKGKNSITDLCYGINALALRQENYCMNNYRAEPSNATDFLKYVRRAISNLLVIDAEKREISLSQAEYNMFRLNDIQFIYANILEENAFTKDSIYFLCEYMDDKNVIRKGNFIAKREWYEKINPKEVKGCKKILCGFCKRKEVKVPAKVRYDKYSHSSFKVAEDSTKKVTRLSVFTLQNISPNGVMVKNENEFLLYNELFRRKIPFEALRKTALSGYKPQAVIHKDGRKVYVEAVLNEDVEQAVEQRRNNLKQDSYGYALAVADEGAYELHMKTVF